VKVFLDTNVLASAYAARGLCADVLRLTLAKHELVVGEVVLQELERILLQRLRLAPELAGEILASLREHRTQPGPDAPAATRVRDPDDAWVLASALEAGADVLITGDADLLDVADEVQGIRITSPRGFWNLIRDS
jgi:putative PIN family toxin of toxin-antitoxin system